MMDESIIFINQLFILKVGSPGRSAPLHNLPFHAHFTMSLLRPYQNNIQQF